MEGIETQSHEMGNEALTLDCLARMAIGKSAPRLGTQARERIERADQFVHDISVSRRLVYGITTGFGPLANCYIDPACTRELQANLIAHLMTGTGPLLAETEVRAIFLARLHSLCQGHSGISSVTLDRLIHLFSTGLIPAVPSRGTVGASGDLTPLAHLTGAYTGQGAFLVDGQEQPAMPLLEEQGLEPVILGAKEGLALVNGTSAMTGIAALNGWDVGRQFHLGLRLGLLYSEVFFGKAEAFDHRVARVRQHPGQLYVHERLNEWLDSSCLLTREYTSASRLPDHCDPEGGVFQGQPLLQNPYSIRCIPQLYGAVHDVLIHHNTVVERELNAVTDNPLLFPDEALVIQAGNFFGQHVAFVSDSLAQAVITLANHCERKIARLVDVSKSSGLPPMLQPERLGNLRASDVKETQ